ncbi:hypothetical protein ACF0H5_004882 [Mactra antiquata]
MLKHLSGEDIALRRPVSHTPVYNNDTYTATLAADGNCDTKFSTSSPYTCSLTNRNNETSPTWTVTLDKTYQITGIVIYNRKQHYNRLANFTVFGSCDEQDKVVLYNDAEHNKYIEEVIRLEINESHVCSTISIQIPQKSISGHAQYLALCEVQVYAVVCRKPTHSSFAVFVPNKTMYAKNESLSFTCNAGYIPIQSNTTVTCCGVDTFCPSYPVCERVYCQLLRQPANGKYNTSTSTNTSLEYGSVLHGKCNIGYEEGILDTTRRCQQNGTWSGQDLVCTQIKCNPPPSVQNGYYTYSDNNTYMYIREPYTTYLTGHCNIGYNLSTPSTISCGLNESWTGDFPVCDIVTCDPPVEKENSYYIYGHNKTTYNKTPEFYHTILLGRCYTGFKITSPLPSELRCSKYGKWSGNLAVCELIICEWPDLQNGNFIGSMAPFYYNDTLTPICNVGYSLENNNTIVCNETEEWSNITIVRCVPCSSNTAIVKEDLFSTGMVVGVIFGTNVFTAIITTVIVYIVIKRCIQANTKPNNLYGDLALRNNSREGEYSDLQNMQHN